MRPRPRPLAEGAMKSDRGAAKGKSGGWRRGVRLKLVVAVLLLAVAAPACLIAYYSIAFPDPRKIGQREAAPIVRVLARDGTVLAERSENNDFIPIDLLPRHVTDALIAIEDRRFYSHHGIDV